LGNLLEACYQETANKIRRFELQEAPAHLRLVYILQSNNDLMFYKTQIKNSSEYYLGKEEFGSDEEKLDRTGFYEKLNSADSLSMLSESLQKLKGI
jgi:hypothetical protein